MPACWDVWSNRYSFASLSAKWCCSNFLTIWILVGNNPTLFISDVSDIDCCIISFLTYIFFTYLSWICRVPRNCFWRVCIPFTTLTIQCPITVSYLTCYFVKCCSSNKFNTLSDCLLRTIRLSYNNCTSWSLYKIVHLLVSLIWITRYFTIWNIFRRGIWSYNNFLVLNLNYYRWNPFRCSSDSLWNFLAWN